MIIGVLVADRRAARARFDDERQERQRAERDRCATAAAVYEVGRRRAYGLRRLCLRY